MSSSAGKKIHFFHHIIYSVYSKRNSDTWYIGHTEQSCEIIVTATTTYASDLHLCRSLSLQK